MQRRNMCSSSLWVFLMMAIPAVAGTLGFKPALAYPVGSAPMAVAVGDFNDDGKPDLAIANSGNDAGNDGSVSILLGNGNGTFQPALNFPAGKNPGSITVSDFDRDGNLDLAVSNPGDPTTGVGCVITILTGTGDGNFHNRTSVPLGFSPRAVVVGDFNGDFKPDLASVGSRGTLHAAAVLLGNGDSSFEASMNYNIGAAPTSIVADDFNEDGKLDLAVAVFKSVDVLLGNGDAGFQSPVTNNAGLFVHDIVSGDLNQDLKPDIAALTSNICDFSPCAPPTLFVMMGNDEGTLQPSVNVGSGAGLAVADFNGDGQPDLATSHSGVVDVLLNKGDATFQTPVSFAAGENPAVKIATDLNGDGAQDLVVVNSSGDTVGVLLNIGTDFSLSASLPSPNPLSRGESSTSAVTVRLLNNFNSPIELTCSVQPTGPDAPTCSIRPESVTPAPHGTALATLTVDTGGALIANSWLKASSWLLFPLLALIGVTATLRTRNKEKKLSHELGSGMLYAALLFQIACGGGSDHPHSMSYSVTVTGSSATNEHSSTISLAIQQ